MRQQFPNPYDAWQATSVPQASASAQAPPSAPATAMNGIQGPAAVDVYGQRNSLPAMPRTASAAVPNWSQQPVPTRLDAPSSVPRSLSNSNINGNVYPQRAGSQARPANGRPPPPGYSSYGPTSTNPRPTPYGIPQAQMPGSHSYNAGPSQRPRPNPLQQHHNTTGQYQPGNVYPNPSSQQQVSQAPRPPYAQQPTSGQSATAGRSPSQDSQSQARRQDSLDLEAAMQASQASAREEEERRRRQEQEEEQQILAMSRREEEERRRKERDEEEKLLQQALEASQREEEERRLAQERQREEEERHAQILLEESRQHALREDEERIRREHADVIARSKQEAMLDEQRRQQALQAEKEMEEAAIRESLREMEEEWRRREEAERAAQAFRAQGGAPGAPLYWQHLNQDAAYELAVDLERRASTLSTSTVSTARSARRPLPPTPQMLSGASSAGQVSPDAELDDQDSFIADSPSLAEHEPAQAHTDRHTQAAEEEGDGEDPFTDQAEAPPMYDDVHVDRPPAAPTTIPDHVQFAPPVDATTSSETGRTSIDVPAQIRDAKTPAAPVEHFASSSRERELPPVPAPVGDTDDNADEQRAGPSSLHRLQSPRLVITNADDEAASNNHEANSRQEVSTAPHSRTQPLSPVPEDESVEEAEDNDGEAPMQRAMKSTEFGYASEPFSPELDSLGTFKAGRFPNLIKLRSDKGDGTLAEPSAYFVIRAPSWKALLRALAWYGNTRVEAGPEEIADTPEGLCLRIEAEFITPTKVKLANARKAFASVSLSLLMPDNTDAAAVEAQASALKNASRALDASYVRQGSTRRVIALPRRAPKLPIDLVRLAQHMHEAHTFSAACPSAPSSDTLHSPRDLSYAVERHDLKFVAKVQRLRRDDEAQLVRRTAGTEEFVSPGAAASTSRSSLDGRQSSEGRNDLDEYDEMDAGAIDIVDGPPGESRISLSRMRERVRKRLARRSGDPRAQKTNEDLESWITPFDLSQHG